MAFASSLSSPTCSRHLTSENLQARLHSHFCKASASHFHMDSFLLLIFDFQSLQTSNTISSSPQHNPFPVFLFTVTSIPSPSSLLPPQSPTNLPSRVENNPPLRNLALFLPQPPHHAPHPDHHHPRTRRRRIRHRRPRPRPPRRPLHRHRPRLRPQTPPFKRRREPAYRVSQN